MVCLLLRLFDDVTPTKSTARAVAARVKPFFNLHSTIRRWPTASWPPTWFLLDPRRRRQPGRGGARTGITTPAVRLALMEAAAGPVAGQPHHAPHEPDARGRGWCLERARRILAEIDDMEQLLGGAKGHAARPAARECHAGLRRSHDRPLISRFARQHPQVELQLQLSVNPPPFSRGCLRRLHPASARAARCAGRRAAGGPTGACCAPRRPIWRARARRGHQPTWRATVHRHPPGEGAYGVWRLSSGRGKPRRTEAVKTRGNLSTNDGEIAVNWRSTATAS